MTRFGEDILEAHDNWGVKELRRLKLVWSSWEGAKKIPEDFLNIPSHAGYGVRVLESIDSGKLRLFFLSLLWRAAASSMREFSEVSVRSSELRRLKRMVVEGDPRPLSRFPMSITQLSTMGEVHNMTPIAQRKPKFPWSRNSPSIPIFRFYLDGLIIHFYRESNDKEVEGFGDMLVGNDEKVIVTTVPFEESWEKSNLTELIREAQEVWPERLAKIPGFDAK